VLLTWLGFKLFTGAVAGPLAEMVFFGPLHILLIIVFGVLLGLLGSVVSVGRHLRRVSDRGERRRLLRAPQAA
jgi:hypothetical protein